MNTILLELDKLNMNLDLYSINIGGIRELHPFQNEGDFVKIPQKYKSIYEEVYDDIDKIPYNDDEIDKLIWNYISIFWLDSWYTDEAQIFTPKTQFYDLNTSNIVFDEPKFARLNSVSSKTLQKVTTLEEAKLLLNESPRCIRLLNISTKYQLPISIAIRKWVDMTSGAEYRCYVYSSKLCAICPHDIYDLDIDDKELETRCQNLLYKARYHLPFEDCVVDVFLSDGSDLIIEFNSYGVWANASSGAFNWIVDKYDLEHLPVTIRGRNTLFQDSS